MPPKSSILLFTQLILFVLIALCGCKVPGNTSQSLNESFEDVVKLKLGPDYLVQNNSDNRFALCQQKRSDNDHMRRIFKYVVVQLKDNKIVREGSFVMGYVKWIDTKQIEVATTSDGDEKPGIRRILIDTE